MRILNSHITHVQLYPMSVYEYQYQFPSKIHIYSNIFMAISNHTLVPKQIPFSCQSLISNLLSITIQYSFQISKPPKTKISHVDTKYSPNGYIYLICIYCEHDHVMCSMYTKNSQIKITKPDIGIGYDCWI